MFGRSVGSLIERRKLLVVAPGTSVARAAKAMAKKKVGAALVVDAGRLVGIFTERDAVFRVLAHDLDPGRTPLGAVMTPEPKTISAERSFGHAMVVMRESGFRHLPVIDGDQLIGIVSARDALDPELEDFVSEERRRKHIEATR